MSVANSVKQKWRNWTAYLLAPIDGASLAIFRIAFGFILAFDIYCHIAEGYIHTSFGVPKFWFSYLPCIRPMSEPNMYALYWFMMLLALLVAVGFHYRFAVSALCLCLLYNFLLDQSLYFNHTYLICLMSFLMCIIPANQVWSLDRHLHKKKFTDSIPRWNLLVLKGQLLTVFFYAGLWKLNPDWLKGIPLEQLFLHEPFAARAFGDIVYQPLFAKTVAVAGTVIDLMLPCLLMLPQTVWLGISISVPFHLLNSVLFKIGVFPWFMLGTLALFPPSNWPRTLWHKLNHIVSKIGTTGSVTEILPAPASPFRIDNNRVATCAALIFFHIYLVVQLIVPLRHLAHKGSVDWTEQGYYFCWRVMLHYKQAVMVVYATDPSTGVRRKVDLRRFLNGNQIYKMRWHPEMAHLFVRWYADQVQLQKGIRPVMTIKCIASLHKRPWQDLIDPRVDLASQPIGLHCKPWIMPLNGEPVELPNYQNRAGLLTAKSKTPAIF